MKNSVYSNNPHTNDYLKIAITEWIILRWMFRKMEGVVGTGWSWLSLGTGGGHL
jgi:hypothetical protein